MALSWPKPKIERKCKQCEYVWVSRVERPKCCPQCISRFWDKAKKLLKGATSGK